MTYAQATILGIVQGITEFLPISSSGHLILIPKIFGWELQDLTFDVLLHLSTALAVLVYFWKDWYEMLKSLYMDIVDSDKLKSAGINKLRPLTKQLLTIVVVSVPVAIAGIILEEKVETTFRSPITVAVILIIVSFVMLTADLYSRSVKNIKSEFKFLDGLFISLSQILALFPGTSRSGITISTGLFRNFSRQDAARFSFLLATPLIVGAGIFKLIGMDGSESLDTGPLVTGFATSLVVGFLSIHFLLSFLRKYTLIPFVVYRILLGIIVLMLVRFS